MMHWLPTVLFGLFCAGISTGLVVTGDSLLVETLSPAGFRLEGSLGRQIWAPAISAFFSPLLLRWAVSYRDKKLGQVSPVGAAFRMMPGVFGGQCLAMATGAMAIARVHARRLLDEAISDGSVHLGREVVALGAWSTAGLFGGMIVTFAIAWFLQLGRTEGANRPPEVT
jgi:hypothetical protein